MYREKVVEVLAPAGSYESFQAAIAAGADAVYAAGLHFGARAHAGNFTEEQLISAIDYAHLHGRKLFLTVNTLLKEQEMERELYDYLLPFYEHGLDAVIVQDIGVLRFVKHWFPELPIHASTQMSITNVLGARFLKEQGVERVVTARELNLDEISEIVKQADLEVESFVHGALCYCYSGQCLLSSLIGGRSGNRGQCAQPCRLPYKVGEKSGYLLSLKDICALEGIPEMIEAGVHSFKIEGRMKKPEYVAAVTSMYRKYVDLFQAVGKERYAVDPRDKEILMDIYNRGGFHEGYYHTGNGMDMISMKRPNHAGIPAVSVHHQKGREITGEALVPLHKGDILELSTEGDNYTFGQEVVKSAVVTFLGPKKKSYSKGMVLYRTRNQGLLDQMTKVYCDRKLQEKIHGFLRLSVSESATLSIVCGNTNITVQGDLVEKAENQPLEEERIRKQLLKTGNTAFVFEQLEIEVDKNAFFSMQKLNELRRKGLEILEETMCGKFRRIPDRSPRSEQAEYFVSSEMKNKDVSCHVLVETQEQLEAAGAFEQVLRIYIDSSLIEDHMDEEALFTQCEKLQKNGKEIYLAMPHIFREHTAKYYKKHFYKLCSYAPDGVLIRNYESIQFLKDCGFDHPVVPDHNLYVFNHYSRDFWKDCGVPSYTAPVELNKAELKAMGIQEAELLIYGYLPVMVSAQCIRKTLYGCSGVSGMLTLTDRFQKDFAVRNVCRDCYNLIYNSTPLMLLDQREEIEELHPQSVRLQFSLENKAETIKVMEAFVETFLEKGTCKLSDTKFTRGHFKRGIK